jgi:hypothetical protein
MWLPCTNKLGKYIFLHGHVKHCEKKWLLLGEWGFLLGVFGDRTTKMPIAKKNHQNMHLQLIKMNLQEENMVINVVKLFIK